MSEEFKLPAGAVEKALDAINEQIRRLQGEGFKVERIANYYPIASVNGRLVNVPDFLDLQDDVEAWLNKVEFRLWDGGITDEIAAKAGLIRTEDPISADDAEIVRRLQRELEHRLFTSITNHVAGGYDYDYSRAACGEPLISFHKGSERVTWRSIDLAVRPKADTHPIDWPS